MKRNVKSKSSRIYILVFLAMTTSPLSSLADSSLRNRIQISKKSHLTLNTLAETEELNSEKAQLLSSKRKGLIQDIRRFIGESRSRDQMAELNMRLGGLYLEEYRSENAKAQIEFEKASEAAGKASKKGAHAPKFDNSEAIANLERARSIYRDLSNRYPNHSRRDEMLYFLALTSLDRGKTNEGMNTFTNLVKQYPNSKYVNEALVQLGDYYFEANKFALAEGYFDKIVQKKFKPLLPYAIYKKGWCAYNTQRPSLALQDFKWVILNEENVEGAGTTIRVKHEALRDITLPFVDLKLVEEGMAFFKSQGDAPYRQGLEMMASLFYEQGDYPRAIQLNEALLAMDANYKKNPSYDISVIESLRMKNDRQAAVTRLFERLPLYLQNSNWYEINASQPETVKEASNSFEELARRYAFEFHGEGQKTKNESLYNAAKLLYAKYLEFFPLTPQSPKVRFYLAEIQFRQKEYTPAAENYHQVYKTQAAGASMRFDAIRYAIQALDTQMNEDRKKLGLAEINAKTTSKLKEAEDAVLQANAFSPVEAKFAAVSEDYLKEYPKTKEAPEVLYEQAYLYYIHYEFVQSYKSFWRLTQEYAGHPTSYSSAYLILDVLNRRKEYPKMVLSCQKFLESKALSQESFRSEVANILRHSELKRIAQLEEKGEHKEAADNYIEYTKAYGTQDESLYEKALYNASVNYMKAGLSLAAVETQEKFLRRFPRSEFRENMILQVAKTYESLGNAEKSALYFEQFGTQYSSNAQAKNALRLAGLYYWGSGNSPKAESVLLTFIRSYPKDRKMVEHDLFDIYQSRGAEQQEMQYLLHSRAEKGIALSEYMEMTVRIAELQAKTSGHIQPVLMEEGLKVVQQHSKTLSETPRGAEAMAKILFWYANQKEDIFYRIKLSLPQRTLEANLQRKLALLKDLEKEYSHIASLGGEWGVGAIYKTAALYRQMSDDIRQAPVPSELTAEQLDIYRGELEKQMIKPFREKALSLSGSCLDKAQEFTVLSSWTSKCYSLAGELEPNRFPVVKTFYLPPYQMAVLVPTAQESKIPVGDYKNFRYPYASASMFQSGRDRTLASIQAPGLPSLYGGLGVRFDEASRAVPSALNYRMLSDERKQILQKTLESEKPSDPKKISFGYLHLLRLVNPQRAVMSIMEAIQKDPTNSALHSLLGAAYLDNGNLPAAKVTWLSLIARGVKSAQIWNNLGVLEALKGNESEAISYFHEAAQLDSKEALSNLGFIALKYRNGFEAKKFFEKATQLDGNLITAQVGLSVARIQNRELDAAKAGLLEANKQFKSDPFAHLSLTYFLMDSEKEMASARQVITEYVQQQGLEHDILFREAMQETEGHAPSGESLPGIE